MCWNKMKLAAVVVAAAVVTAGVGPVAVAAHADEATTSRRADPQPPAAKMPPVREINLLGYKAEWKSGSVLKPAEIKSAEELAKAIPNEDWRAKITEQVDFTKEKLLYFVWLGSSGDKLTFTFAEGKNEAVVTFHYAEMLEHMMRAPQHFHLYALPRGANCKVETAKAEPFRIDLPNPPALKQDTSTAMLLKDLESEDPHVRGVAIDLLGERKAKEAVPKLIALTSDGTALIGSDNYVGLHAMHALTKITGQPFDLDQKKWQAWWKDQQKAAESPAVAADSGVRVLSAEATVELRGLLVHTPKGTFIMVREFRPFATTTGSDKEGEVVTWELDFGKKAADLEQQAKDLSGKPVLVNGTCKMVSVLTYGANPLNPAVPSGSEWRLEKILVLSKLSAAEKK